MVRQKRANALIWKRLEMGMIKHFDKEKVVAEKTMEKIKEVTREKYE